MANTNYIANTNEVIGYHNMTIEELENQAQYEGNELALEIIERLNTCKGREYYLDKYEGRM